MNQQLEGIETRLKDGTETDTLLLQLRSDRRLGHEWDDWDGDPLPADGVFEAHESLFFKLAAFFSALWAAGAGVVIWLLRPRLVELWAPLPNVLFTMVGLSFVLWIAWLVAVWGVMRTGENWLPGRLAERGLLPWVMPRIERLAVRLGVSRDRSGNAMLRVYNTLALARTRIGLAPGDLLILLPRCLGKDAMRDAMGISARYGVPMFVAARGRYARQMIAMRRPKAVVAVACERDLVSGVHDVAHRLPVLGTTLQLGDGPCRNTSLTAPQLERQVRALLGLNTAGTSVG